MQIQTSNSPRTEAATGPTVSLLRMSIAGETFAVPIAEVREILQVGRLTPMPRTPEFVRGVMNLRGAVVPVIDVAARLDRGGSTVGRRSCIVVVEVAPESCDGPPLVAGLLVDAVFEVLDREAAAIETAPELGTSVPPVFLRGITRADGQLIGVLELEGLLSVEALSAAIAAHRAH